MILLYSHPQKVDLCGNNLAFQIKCDANNTVLATLFVENPSAKGTYSTLPEFEVELNNSNIADLVLGSILKSRFRNFFDLPDFNLATPVKAKVTTLNYYLEFREMDGDTEVFKLTTETYVVLNGRVNHSDYPSFDLRTWLNSEKRFLSNTPTRLYDYRGTTRFFYYMSVAAGITKVSTVLKTRHNNIVDEQFYESPVLELAQNEVMIIPLKALIDKTPEPFTVNSATVVLKAGGREISQPVNIYYRPKPIYGRAILFLNRFGVFDTVITSWQSNTVKTTRKETVANLAPGYSRYVGNMSSDVTEVTDTFTAETGPVTAALAEHYKELAESDVAFLVSDDRYIRVNINKGSFKIVNEEKDLHNVKFSYQPAFKGDLIGTKITLPEPSHEDYSAEYLDTDYK